MKRIYSIDFTRGLVMMIMALDHVRDLMHVNSVAQSPTDLATTTPLLFFTRWITYLCAPIFVFLAGTSAYLSLKNKRDVLQSRNFLLTRGLWLIALEFTVVNFGLFFDAGFHLLLFEVIAAIGMGFIVLSFLVNFSPKVIGIIGLVIIFGHDLFSLIPFNPGTTAMKAFFSPLFTLAGLPLFANHVLVIAYPPIPWLGIMLAGFGTGKMFAFPEEKRKRVFTWLGMASILLFIMVRFINKYGDPVPWSSQKTPVFTFLSFMNISKYPPSLTFTLITLGVMFLILAFAENIKNRVTGIAYVYGKAPLFYFIVHFYIIHTLLILVLLIQGYNWQQMSFAAGTFGRPRGAQSGIPLWAVYLVWIGVVAALYKPCIWFGTYKTKHNNWWLRYL